MLKCLWRWLTGFDTRRMAEAAFRAAFEVHHSETT